MKTKYLIVLEGPAGSGKTTVVQSIAQVGGIAEVRVLSRPAELGGVRSYRNECAPTIADFYRLMGLLYGTPKTYVSDRFWMSSMIYQPLKRTNGRYDLPWSYPHPHLVADNTIALGDWVISQMDAMQVRDPSLDLPDQLCIDFYVLLPSMPLLELNRSRSGREYPFVGEVEIAHYENFVNSWRGFYSPRVTIGLHPFELYQTSDYSRVTNKAKLEIGRVSKWVREPQEQW